MKYRPLLFVTLPLLFGACQVSLMGSSQESLPAPGAARPNVVLVLVDDLAWGDISINGNPYVQTPHIDRLARQSVELTRYRTQPGCSPTRAAVLTGRYPFRSGVAHVFDHLASLDGDAVTLAEALKGEGYRSALIGKWHLDAGKPSQSPTAQGFEHVLSFPGPALRPGGYSDMPLWRNGIREEQKGYCMDVFTDDALRWIKTNKDEPFFLYFAANLIHSPMEVPEEFIDHSQALTDSTKKAYGMLRNFDLNLGRLMKGLEELGLDQNTLMVFTSDDGPCGSSKPNDRFNAGFHGLKNTPYEGGIRVPCYVRWPARLPAPARLEQNTSDIDLMPTILAACGVPGPAGVVFDGKNLLPALKQPQAPAPERTLFYQNNLGDPVRGRGYAAVSGNWKLVQPCLDPDEVYIRKVKGREPGRVDLNSNYAPLCKAQGRPFKSLAGEPRFELYDLATDPTESKDISAQHPEIVERLRAAYDQWFTDVERDWTRANVREQQSTEGRRPRAEHPTDA
jgi:arylsulfatase A